MLLSPSQSPFLPTALPSASFFRLSLLSESFFPSSSTARQTWPLVAPHSPLPSHPPSPLRPPRPVSLTPPRASSSSLLLASISSLCFHFIAELHQAIFLEGGWSCEDCRRSLISHASVCQDSCLCLLTSAACVLTPASCVLTSASYVLTFPSCVLTSAACVVLTPVQ